MSNPEQHSTSTPQRSPSSSAPYATGMDMTESVQAPRDPWANAGVLMRDLILGGQDGLVNVLGLVLGVAAGSADTNIVIIAGLAGTFAESISMGAVAYTSTKAERDYTHGMIARERQLMEDDPAGQQGDIRQIYARKGFTGHDLELIVDVITSDRKVWLETMLLEELRLPDLDGPAPWQHALVVGGASVAGSLVPVIPYFLWSVGIGTVLACVASAVVLIGAGIYRARVTKGRWEHLALEMLIIGSLAAAAGYLIGVLLGVGAA